MGNNQLTTRWRALHGLFKESIQTFKRRLVNPKTWKVVIVLFRLFMSIVRLLQIFV